MPNGACARREHVWGMDGLPPWAGELLRDARVARLGLLDDDGAPRVLPVTFAIADGRVYSAVDDKPKRRPGQVARVRFLRARPQAALTVDRYDDDWEALAWVQLLGTVRVLDDPSARPDALAALIAKYAQYRERPPRGPLLELSVARALHWCAGATVQPMPERLQLLHYDYVENIVERRAPHREAHLALVGRWKEEGRLVMGGAVGDPPHGGLIVLRGEPADVRAFVEEDPYVLNGLVTDWRVEPWNVVT